VVYDLAWRPLDVQDGAGDEVPTRRDEEERLTDRREALRGADRAIVVELEAARNGAAQREVAGEPLPAPTIADADTHVPAHVVFTVTSHENAMNSTFFAQIAHQKTSPDVTIGFRATLHVG
jgi:hypothetical protein